MQGMYFTIKLFNVTVRILPFSNQTAELQSILVNLWHFLGWRYRFNSHSYPDVCERLPHLLSDDWTTAWQSKPRSNYTVSVLTRYFRHCSLHAKINPWNLWLTDLEAMFLEETLCHALYGSLTPVHMVSCSPHQVYKCFSHIFCLIVNFYFKTA